MTTTLIDFVKALEYLVSIEPDPEVISEEDDYDEHMAQFEDEIQKAEATIRAYGEQIAPQGLAHMQTVLYDLLGMQTSGMAESITRSTVNRLWDGCGQWRG